MTSLEAIKHWGMSRWKKKRLEDVCWKHPEKYIKDGRISIPDNARPIYIPDNRVKGKHAHYTHIINAVAKQQELLPNSIGITPEALAAYIEQLVQANILKYIDGYISKGVTTNCILSLQAEDWLDRKAKEKRKFIMEIVNAVMPNGLISPISLDIQ